MTIFDLIPYDHFGEIQMKVMKQINNGESCLIYGMYGSGIQYFLKHLSMRLQSLNRNVIFLRGSLFQENAIEEIKNNILKISKKKDLTEALNYFNDDRKLYIFIDGFQLIKNVAEVLHFLGAIRKTNPHNIINIIGSDQSYLVELKEFFIKNDSAISSVNRLGLFDIVGVRKMININNEFFGWNIPVTFADKILKLSGGNPRLIKYISKTLMEEGIHTIDNYKFLSSHPLIESKLNKFVDILFKYDIDNLKNLLIINDNGNLFSELLKYKVENYELPNLSELFPEFTNRERKVFSYLFINKGKLVSSQKMDFIFNLVDNSYSLWASYKAINRLKQKISGRFELRNIKGKGYILEEMVR